MSNNDPPLDDSTVPILRRRGILKGAAAAGTLLGAGTGLASAHPKPRKLVLVALVAPVEYRVEVSGEIALGPNAEDDDEVHDGNVVVGEIDSEGELDDFEFSGEIVACEVTKGKVEARIDGETVDPKKVKKDGDDKDEKDGHDKKDDEETHEITLVASGSTVTYQFVVSGDLEPGSEFDESDSDAVHGDTATGVIGGKGRDSFRFTGDITRFHVSNDDLTVLIDGEAVDPDDLGEGKLVNIEAHGTFVEYEFEVSGMLEPALSADVEVDDEVVDGTARGNVAGRGHDDYWITGEVTRLELSNDDVTVTVDGQVVHAP